MYRKKDLQFLQDIYDRPSNDIALLYGVKETGLSEIVSDLIRDKECVYYRACAVDDRTQKHLLALALHDQAKTPLFPEDEYERLIISYINEHTDKKKIIVLDDFLYLIKGNPTFINFLTSLLSDKCKPAGVMILLVCDDVRWVENDMLRLIGKKSSEIAGVVKMNEYSFSEFTECFPDMPVKERMGIYSFTGGKSVYYNDLGDESTLRETVIKQLGLWSRPDFDPNTYLPADIREPAVYNTILTNIAAGEEHPGDLHDVTGIERAKLSVYLRKLIEFGIVRKTVFAGASGTSGSGKGMYVIGDRMTRFYYRYVFPHASTLYVTGPERFYRRYIEQDLGAFIEEVYPIFCMEYIRRLQKEGRLSFKVSSVEEFYDRNKAIDFIIVAAGGSVIACACRYDGLHMNAGTYEDVKLSVKKNRLPCENIWLFSEGGFDQKLTTLAGDTAGVKLIDGKDQRLR